MASPDRRRPVQDESDTDEENDDTIDPELRLRTVRTAASTIAESVLTEARIERRKTRAKKRLRFFKRSSEKKKASPDGVDESQPAVAAPIGKRRNIYVNSPLPPDELDSRGEPVARYVRNKVRTTKYTIVSFIPKNLYEQFRRVANLYFLALVIIQVFPIFGAAAAQISMLPLVFILSVTALKDGIEDYRRAVLDDEVNNSAATKLGDWRNVNQPKDPRNWFERLLHINAPGRVTKGVRKLRTKEAGEWNGRVVLMRSGEVTETSTVTDSDRTHAPGPSESSFTLNASTSQSRLNKFLDDDPHAYSLSYPPPSTSTTTTLANVKADELGSRFRSGSLTSGKAMSMRSRRSFGVVDWNRQTSGTARWERTLWKKLEVGDIVLLRENDQVPADIVVLSTSEPDGLCYLETKNLDGETNLKPRKSLKATTSLQCEEDIEHASFVLDAEPPHQNLYLFNGVLRYRSNDGRETVEPATINELLLRGCSVRNTSWIIGLVVFTGADTKIMLNGGNTPSKRSKIEKETNFNVVMNFIILMGMCVATAIASGVYDGLDDTSSRFFEDGSDPSSSSVVNAIVTFASSLIAFQNIVPISLYISIEIVKTIQAFFISQDVDMFYAPYDTACVPKTWNISDDLGQIEYIFSDKTGTLTQNVMEFQKCSVNGVAYGEGVTEAQRGSAKRRGEKGGMDPAEESEKLAMIKEDMLQKMSRTFTNRWIQPDKLTLISPSLANDLADKSAQQRDHLIAFFRALAICHSVLADRPDPQMRPYHLDYKAESPDESALVAAARDVGFPFVTRTNGMINIEVMGQSERYTQLKLLEFNSTRKRMSVIVRNPEGRIVLYTKGADSVIYERLAADHDPQLKAKTAKDMEDFANGGLRTLCIASRYLSDDEYSSWSAVYDAAASAVVDRDEEIEKANEQIEHSLYILGATALEDKLQEGVPEAIEMLHSAGIKLWILTGDKVQTAIEIGFSCNLLKQSMEIMIITATSLEEARSKIEAGLNRLASVLGPPRFNPKERGFVPGAQAAFAVVIDGDTLRFALDESLKTMFLNLATQCETVVCCRVSPAQKALTVKLVKDGRNAMTLSIGDGANDVAMIQEANIGCGLFGLEGSQAAMSADYAFGQFRFLTKLLIVHGRWSYKRIADMHGNFFYKNVIWTFAMFWYLFYNSFDATYLYQYTFILLYNLVFTSLPVIVLGAFDQDINAKAVLAFPQLYVRGIRGLEYTRLKFWLYMGDGLYQSVIVYFIAYFTWSLGPATSSTGRGIDSLADFGTTIAVSAIVSANTYVGLNTHYWTILTWIVVIGSSLVMIIWISVYSAFDSVDFNDEVVILYGSITFWGTVIVSVALALAPRFLAKFASSAYWPLDSDIVREAWVKGDLKKQLGIPRRKERKTETPQQDMESAPMYRLHERSISESSREGGYEPAPTRSPNDPGSAKPSPNVVGYNDDTQPTVWRDSMSSVHPNVEYVVDGEPEDGLATPTASRAAVSPHPSYYSVSDLPPPSPLPAPRYSYYNREGALISSGPPTATLSSAPSSPGPQQTLQPPTLDVSGRVSPSSPQSQSQSHRPQQQPQESYEMQVRAPPPSSFPTRLQQPSPNPNPNARASSRASEASRYATASEGWTDADSMASDDDYQRMSTVSVNAPRAV